MPASARTTEDLEMFERTAGTRDLLSSKWKVDLVDLRSRHETAVGGSR